MLLELGSAAVAMLVHPVWQISDQEAESVAKPINKILAQSPVARKYLTTIGTAAPYAELIQASMAIIGPRLIVLRYGPIPQGGNQSAQPTPQKPNPEPNPAPTPTDSTIPLWPFAPPASS